jgi:hypothetical protein
MPGLGREAWARASNLVRARGFARQAARQGPIPSGAVALWFGTTADNLYQFEQWRRPLEAYARRRPVFVIVDRPDTGRTILTSTRLPIAFARGSAPLERLVAERDIRAVLYVNQVESNFRMLRFGGPVHIQIGHGESDKAGSASNQHKAYDLTFVGGTAGRERLGNALYDFDPEMRTCLTGRPQLDYAYPGAPGWPRDDRIRLFYAPTWEGDRPSIAYGSLASHGPALVGALCADPRVRVIYRPHPRTGRAAASHRMADRAVRQRLQADGERHLVDTGGAYGWQWAFADVCVTDISAVAYDWLATGKPLLITEPVEPRAYRPPSALLDALPLLPAAEVGQALKQLVGPAGEARRARLQGLSQFYFGDTSPGASTRRFEAALEAAIDARWRARQSSGPKDPRS